MPKTDAANPANTATLLPTPNACETITKHQTAVPPTTPMAPARSAAEDSSTQTPSAIVTRSTDASRSQATLVSPVELDSHSKMASALSSSPTARNTPPLESASPVEVGMHFSTPTVLLTLRLPTVSKATSMAALPAPMGSTLLPIESVLLMLQAVSSITGKNVLPVFLTSTLTVASVLLMDAKYTDLQGARNANQGMNLTMENASSITVPRWSMEPALPAKDPTDSQRMVVCRKPITHARPVNQATSS